jgi:hypothetical protein
MMEARTSQKYPITSHFLLEISRFTWHNHREVHCEAAKRSWLERGQLDVKADSAEG